MRKEQVTWEGHTQGEDGHVTTGTDWQEAEQAKKCPGSLATLKSWERRGRVSWGLRRITARPHLAPGLRVPRTVKQGFCALKSLSLCPA